LRENRLELRGQRKKYFEQRALKKLKSGRKA